MNNHMSMRGEMLSAYLTNDGGGRYIGRQRLFADPFFFDIFVIDSLFRGSIRRNIAPLSSGL